MDDIRNIVEFSLLQTGTLNKIDFFRKYREDLLNENLLKKQFAKKVIENLFFDIKKYTKDIDILVSKIKNKESSIIVYEEDDYPFLLSNIKDPPCVLFADGRLSLLEKENTIGVVGARKTDLYGKDVCKDIVSKIAEANMVIVSGLAIGIDNNAHKAALAKNGDTIGVVPVQHHTPVRTNSTRREMYDKGLVLAEYPSFVPIKPWMYISRNRIIAGLSKGVFVVRAAIRSGSLSTASFATSYNRDVFALPGNIYEILSAGTAKLIKDGAVPVFSADDILSFYHLKNKKIKEKNVSMTYSLKEEEKKIIDLLSDKVLHVDEIAFKSGLSTKKAKTILTGLELKSYVVRMSGENYSLVR